jgi:prepilin-type N-terminal cleavage/methylation domain-containing protein
MMPPANTRRGFSLMELAAAIAVLGLLLSMMAVVLWATVRIEKAEAASFHRAMSIAHIADQFRLDVSQAMSAPESTDDATRSPQCLILKSPDGRTIIYRWDNRRLERVEKQGDREGLQFLTLPQEIDSVDFSKVKRNETVLEMVLRPEQVQRSIPRKQATVIQAVLGGDLR